LLRTADPNLRYAVLAQGVSAAFSLPQGSFYTAGTVENTLYYYYDESGISGLEYNGTKYAYVKNLQGDVIGIINANGVTVVEYKYDAWGNVLSVTGSMASTLGATNPFRYRGYYYDAETGWYYLNSRYYDPQVGRFLNADGYVSTGQGLSGYNMFAYCNDNPIMFSDPLGRSTISAAKSPPSEVLEEIDRYRYGMYDDRPTTEHYVGSYTDFTGTYEVHRFDTAIRRTRNFWDVLFGRRGSLRWTSAEYYFRKVDCREELEYHQDRYDYFSKRAFYESYSSAAPSYGHVVIDLVMAVYSVRQLLDEKQAAWHLDMIKKYERGYTLKLEFVVVTGYENDNKISQYTIYISFYRN
jgi:RHS repeat-associated protein